MSKRRLVDVQKRTAAMKVKIEKHVGEPISGLVSIDDQDRGFDPRGNRWWFRLLHSNRPMTAVNSKGKLRVFPRVF